MIVARNASERLPGKATRKILGRETLALLMERLKRCRTLDRLILATSTDASDDILENLAKREGILFFRGSSDNVSLRIYEAIMEYGGDPIVRITGDDILRDERMIDNGVRSHLKRSCDVTFMENMPYGTSSEILTLNTLETILKHATVPANTEYLTWYLEDKRYFSAHTVNAGYTFDPELRLTLDYEEDFELFKHIFEHFYPTNPRFTLSDVLVWLQEHPDIAAINKCKTPKYTPRDLDLTLNKGFIFEKKDVHGNS